MKKFFVKTVSVWMALFFVLVPFAFAEEVGVGAITEPLDRIYDLVKGVISVVAVLALTFAGARFMFSGDNIQARESAKSMVSYAVVGLVLVWVAPLLVGYLTSPM